MTDTLRKTPRTYFRLDEAAWIEVGAAYMAGATGAALAEKWRISPGTIYRQARLRGWSKRRDGSDYVRASHPPPAVVDGKADYGEPAPNFVPDPRFMIERYTAGELFEPGVVAQIAASASGGAMMTGQYADAYVLAQIALTHARIVKLRPMSLRAALLELLQDRAMADEFFSFTRRDGEEDEKRAYWSLQHARDRELAEGRAAMARVAVLEAQLNARGAEV